MKCKNCPLGKLSGSMGGLTFSYNRGRQVVYLKPPKEKLVRLNPQVRNSRILLGLLSQMCKSFDPFIRGYWKPRRKTYLTPMNLFIKINHTALYYSIPDKNNLMSVDNFFSLDKLTLTNKGKITEPFQVTGASYKNNVVSVNWSTETYNGIGKPDDTANVWVIYCEPAKKFSLAAPKNSDIPDFIVKSFKREGLRKDGIAKVEVEGRVEPRFMAAFVFFSDGAAVSETRGVGIY